MLAFETHAGRAILCARVGHAEKTGFNVTAFRPLSLPSLIVLQRMGFINVSHKGALLFKWSFQ